MYKLTFNSGRPAVEVSGIFDKKDGKEKVTKAGSYEFVCTEPVELGENRCLPTNPFVLRNPTECEKTCFWGWRLKIKIGGEWYGYDQTGSLFPYLSKKDGKKSAILPEGVLIPVWREDVEAVLAIAVWGAVPVKSRKDILRYAHNSGIAASEVVSAYDLRFGTLKTTKKQYYEYTSCWAVNNDGTVPFGEPYFLPRHDGLYAFTDFRGWRLRVQVNGVWFWYGAEGELLESIEENEVKLWAAEDMLPVIPKAKKMTAYAIWK